MRTNISKTTTSRLKPALLLLVYVMHTCVFYCLSFASLAHQYVAPKTEKLQQHNKQNKKPYSFFVVKHVAPLKLKDAVEKEPVAVYTLRAELPQPKHTGVCNTNPYTYCLPDDSYKRYRSLRSLLI